MFKKIIYRLINLRYGVPKNCKIKPSCKIKNINCEGYNILSDRVIVDNVSLGFASYISKESELSNAIIGRYCCIGPRVKQVSGQHPTSKFVSIHPAFYSLRKQAGFSFVDSQLYEEFRYADFDKKHSIIVGNDVWIGSDVRIMEGVTISDGAIVAAGALVLHDVPPYAIVGGVPAKIIKYRFDNDTIEKLKKIQWWNWNFEKISKLSDKFKNIDVFFY